MQQHHSNVLPQLLGFEALSSERPLVAVAPPVSFRRSLVRACAVSDDGLALVEFDARPLLAAASDDDLQLLADEWFVGNGPGCRRLLERAGPDAQAFIVITEARGTPWSMTVDAAKAREWIRAHRPYLSNIIDPELCAG